MRTLLLDRREEDVQIIEKMMKAAAKNYKRGKKMMTH
jgi:hypothetical protein